MTITWMDQAACKGASLDLFFPVAQFPDGYAEARSYCARCPVADACLRWAISVGAWHGMWGGLTPEERMEVARGAQPGKLRRTYQGIAHGTTAAYYREKKAGLAPCELCRTAYNEKAIEKRARYRRAKAG